MIPEMPLTMRRVRRGQTVHVALYGTKNRATKLGHGISEIITTCLGQKLFDS